MENKGSGVYQKMGCAEPLVCSLETGHLLTKPIGYIESCFAAKNGTPRQPSVCSLSRGCLRISKMIFNNPEHSLMDLQFFSHVWILFVFHKNGRLSCKAKVQPPRLNGAKTGVFSTRSPHRPNAIGLTLAKLDKIEGGTLYLSGIDMIQGTPVIDIKPYIAEYDSPQQPTLPIVEMPQEDNNPRKRSTDGSEELEQSPKHFNNICHNTEDKAEYKSEISDSHAEILDVHQENTTLKTADELFLPDKDSYFLQTYSAKQPKGSLNTQHLSEEIMSHVSTGRKEEKCTAAESLVPPWVKEAPVASLKVRFTPHAENELRQFQAPGDSGEPSFHYFQSSEEAKCAVSTVLSADPRSVYRRNRCLDRLFYFSLDTMHITCWFGDGFAEVVRIQPFVEQAKT